MWQISKAWRETDFSGYGPAFAEGYGVASY